MTRGSGVSVAPRAWARESISGSARSRQAIADTLVSRPDVVGTSIGSQ
jgi:hypothetical protein